LIFTERASPRGTGQKKTRNEFIITTKVLIGSDCTDLLGREERAFLEFLDGQDFRSARGHLVKQLRDYTAREDRRDAAIAGADSALDAVSHADIVSHEHGRAGKATAVEQKSRSIKLGLGRRQSARRAQPAIQTAMINK
jgi:hypothetical protein